MTDATSGRIGFSCAYTPLALMDAAGYAPYRILPIGEWPDQAGQMLHDNLCPHVKRILDRAVEGDLPDLSGVVFVNSCDAMRRLADAWLRVRPDDRIHLVDLPMTPEEDSVSFFANELSALAETLSRWSGNEITSAGIKQSVSRYDELADLLKSLSSRAARGALKGGSAEAQRFYNRAMTEPIDSTVDQLRAFLKEPELSSEPDNGVPVFLFGNVQPDPEVFSLFESCGVRIAAEDMCTGSRMFKPLELAGTDDVFLGIARSLLAGPTCARTFEPSQPGKMSTDILDRARACGAKGVIGYTLKFCDPYLGRLPKVRNILKEAGVPLLLLEGACTMRSMGQQRTRIEAFAEMLR
jgi:benzoyl-CoA reductase/2-hydroxyglutaryl-CoA dehydratase subunit BcrC/BadD/HgdB